MMSMMKPIAILLILSLAATMAARQVVQFRLKKDPAAKVKVYCIKVEEEGIQIEYLGNRRKGFVRWSDIVDADRTRLRIKFKLDLNEDEKKGLIPGHEVFFRGGASVTGIVEKKDEKTNQIFVRTDGMVLPYPLDRLDRIEDIKILETDAYDEEEIYVMRLQRRPPTNWGDHRRLANYLYEIGNYKQAQKHYETALELREKLRAEIEPRLAEIKEILDDEGALAAAQKAKSIANLWGRYKDAQAMLEAYAEENPGSRRRIISVIDEIEHVRIRKLTSRYHRVKARSADLIIRNYLLQKKPTLEEARSWITTELKDLVMKRVQKKMGVTSEELAPITETKAKGAAHWSSYGAGSFVMSPTAKKGKSSGRDIRGDPESWWRGYGDVSTRSSWLKSYAVETLPDLFEIISVRQSDCKTCGGTGVVSKMSVRGLKALGGKHTWKEVCPRCFGARVDRGIGYR